jgi:hypothetical protein
MAKHPAGARSVAMCPDCQGELTYVCSWTVRGLWGYNEVHTYECATHGPCFIGPQIAPTVEASQTLGQRPDDGDRDSLIPARRRPAPTLNADAIALPEPESD